MVPSCCRTVIPGSFAAILLCAAGWMILAQPVASQDPPAPGTPESVAPGDAPQLAPLTETQIDWHMRNRLSFGPRLGELPGDPSKWREWVESQLDPASIDDTECATQAALRYPSLFMPIGESYTAYWPKVPDDFEELTQELRDQFFAYRNERLQRLEMELRESVLYRAAHSKRQFQEVMVEFWRNHLNIDQNKGNCRYFVNDYEERVIRKHAFGHFEEMLIASAKHPAMLIYLDNDVSQKPLTEEELRQLELIRKKRLAEPNAMMGEFARNLERQSGLNENYARELMELHTLGVDNHYTQQDVFEVARTLTGWAHGWQGMPYESEYGFQFRDPVHDKDPKRILGTRLKKGGGEKEGVDTVRMLARHPGTADFLAWKLCRYLVNDEPEPALLARVAKVFRDTRGHLPSVYRAIILDPEFIHTRNYRAKFKSPFEYVVSAMRATDVTIDDPRTTLFMLHRMGQPLYQCADPTGYFDQTEAWLDPGVLVHRWDFALRLVSGRVEGVRMSPLVLESLGPLPSGARLEAIQKLALPDGLGEREREALAKAQSAPYLLGLVLGSPAFQQQ